MATTYRISRNIEVSLINYINAQLALSWTNFNVEKTFARVYGIAVNQDTKNFQVCVRCGITDHDWVEIGGNSTVRKAQVLIDIFGANDGQRLDVKDYLIEKLRSGCVYYDYVITNGTIDSKTADGRIRVTSIDDTPIDFDIDKDKLDIHDRYRHLLTLTVSRGKVEA